jgi:group I intron endonuclease
MWTKAGVYEIQNSVTGYCYIGSSVNMSKRYIRHISDLKRQVHVNPYLQNAWNKYGENAFVFRAILRCDKSMTTIYEQKCLDTMEHEYNLAKDAIAPNKGRVFSAEVRAKMSNASARRKHTEETKRKIGLAHKGKKKSAETIEKHRIAITGVPMSRKARRNMSKAGKGRKFSDVHKAKIGAKTKARWNSEEYRERLSKSLTGRVFSEEAKQKMRDAWIRRKARANE